MKLLVRPKPEKGESFIGYLVRLTELNGYDTPSWVLSLADIDYMELQWTFSFVFGKTKGLKRLANLTNNTLEDLKTLVYSPANSFQGNTTEHEFDFYGAFLNRSIIRPHHPKICPQCLAEFGYCLLVWDCSLVTACPIHECILLDKCPKCRRQIRAIRKSVSICGCGCDWRDFEPKRVAEREMSVSRQIYRLCNRRLSDERCAPSKNPLNTLNLRDFIVAVTFLAGCKRSVSWATGRPSKSIKLSNSELHELYAHAYSVFDDWPANFFQFLKNKSKGPVRLQPHDGKLDTALKREFGSVYECLYQNLEGPQFDFLRKAFTQFLTDRMRSHSVPPPGTPSGSSSSESAKYISLVAARRSLKITNAALFDLIAAGEIHCAIIDGRRSPEFALNKIDVERLISDFEQSITPRDLAELGVGYEIIQAMTNRGLIRPQARRSTDGFHTLRFTPTAAKEFLENVITLDR